MLSIKPCSHVPGKSPFLLTPPLIFTARKRSLRRLCFYTWLGGGGLHAHTWGGPPGPHPGGLQAHTQGVCVSEHALRQDPLSRPTPQGKLRGLARGGLQAHSRGGSPGPHLGGVSRPTPGGGCVCVSQHALRQTPPHGRLLPRAVRILLECILV